MKKLIASLVLIVGTCSLSAQTFYVSPSGDNDFPGSELQPWQSIQHAMDNATVGSTVLIEGGIYNESLYVNVSGDEGAYITFKALDENEVIVDGDGLTSYALLEIYNVHHITIENITLRNHQQLDAVGILIEEACDHIRIENCKIHDINFSTDPEAEVTSETNAQPIAVYGTDAEHIMTDIELWHNEIFDCRLGFSEALVVNGNVQFFEIIGNTIHDVTNIGIDIIGHEGTCDDPALDQARFGLIAENKTYNCLSPYATSAGIYVDGGRDLIIERNEVYNNQWGIEIGCENIGKSTGNIVVRNNLIYGNQTAGIQVGGFDYPSGSGKVENCLILNNTFYGNDTDEDFTGEIYVTYNESLYISRNIFYATNNYGMILSTEDIDLLDSEIGIVNNCFYASSGDPQFYYNLNDYDGLDSFENLGNVNDNVNVDPLFVDEGIDYNINELSPMVDQGDDEFLEASGDLDFEAELRVENGVIDLGAFEFGNGVSLDELEIQSFTIYPNPSSEFISLKGDNPYKFNWIKIYNIQGQVILSESFQPNMNLDISYFENGTYLMELISDNGDSYLTRWVKQ